ncbi:mitochondrial folate transporter/carrier-like isoform X2 [Poeciliopsis prolifica]|uniref:mitochondrial folate transporter/carrier-like isoform X2 n=1 Tax=Poeciliopsis prolifica TaxID=188132 RepID=UPI002413C203|nr:mitochondrial folate transporter/carrier-like isoform X2 [Poeciliopsis prolifica]
MGSAPDHRDPTETPALPRRHVSAVSVAGHVQQVFSHVKVENLVAGLSGGVVSTLVLHPLDLVKIRFAVSDGLELRPKYSGILHCMKSVWHQEGVRGLYQGVTPNIWGAGLSWGLYFFFYNAIKGSTKEGREAELSPAEHLLSAAEAGILTLTITNPIWVTKTRLVLQYSADPSSKQYKGMVDALVKIYRHEGLPGLYKLCPAGLRSGSVRYVSRSPAVHGLRRAQERLQQIQEGAFRRKVECSGIHHNGSAVQSIRRRHDVPVSGGESAAPRPAQQIRRGRRCHRTDVEKRRSFGLLQRHRPKFDPRHAGLLHHFCGL